MRNEIRHNELDVGRVQHNANASTHGLRGLQTRRHADTQAQRSDIPTRARPQPALLRALIASSPQAPAWDDPTRSLLQAHYEPDVRTPHLVPEPGSLWQ